MNMTPEQKLKLHVLQRYGYEGLITAGNIDTIYDGLDQEDELQDTKEEVRQSGIETNIKAPFSRHYESDSVAAQMSDGTWIGWTYWHGGGKDGEPEAMDWMSDAYELTVLSEEPVTTIKRTFAKNN